MMPTLRMLAMILTMRYERARRMKDLHGAGLGGSVERAYFRQEATILTHYGEPRAVLVSYDWYRHHRPETIQKEEGTYQWAPHTDTPLST